MMQFKKALAVAALAATAASSAQAGLVGTTLDFNVSSTGSAWIPIFGPSSASVGAGTEFSACVLGPSNSDCSSGGLSVGIDISDTVVTIAFSGSSIYSPGGFMLALTGFDEQLLSIVPVAGKNLAEGDLSLIGRSDSSAAFYFSTRTFFDGTNQANYTFNLTTAARVPEPVSLALVGVALLSCAAAARRRA